MEQEAFLTPRKIFQNAFNAARKSTAGANSPSMMVYTPTSLTRSASTSGRFNLMPVIHTPPSRLVNGKVINPFEAHLADRLHLPVICSPSLFHRPSTPQAGSVSQFEWTIDEVSYLGPANVEAHETQFMETPDPVLEAKAQAAISSYFKDNNIVPSPVDCQLRNQKINFTGESPARSSFIGRKAKRRRDGITQTVLSFPPNLPKEIEDLLVPYFNFHDNQQQTHETIEESDVSIDHEARDASLRRKLFNCSYASTASGSDRNGDSLDQIDLRSISPAPITPEIDKDARQILKRSRCFGSQEITIDPADISLSPVLSKDKESFGALSPISKSSVSPSPLKPPINSTELESDHDAIYRSTPERPKALLQMNCSTSNSHHMSVELSDSHRGDKKANDLTVEFTEGDFSYDDTENASSGSSSIMSQYPTTPLRHSNSKEIRRNRKNLSRSFLMFSDEDRLEEEREEQVAKEIHRKSFSGIIAAAAASKENSSELQNSTTTLAIKSAGPEAAASGNFFRMDSGFNEEETRGSYAETVDYETDISMQSDYCESLAPRPQGGVDAPTKDSNRAKGCSIRL
ncbi:protein aurora borealis [Toxorhynchites rutilus septentrionalis]|uniref:protein aurora borealis n=1 Tax=Toxorhynchites rutilus septentrionalis TaxID=329112 RepID=UPI002479438C|nr:protein aurora borealis [Toxorhynchites rutilus septentrionalis]